MIESVQHLFFACPIFGRIWTYVLNGLGISNVLPIFGLGHHDNLLA
jgi:hypothetical protein